MICSLPPPPTGQSLVNRALLNDFSASLSTVKSNDISQGNSRGLFYHISRIKKLIRTVFHLLLCRDRYVFLSSESGLGVFYIMLLFSVARLQRKTTFLHHHVYNYITRPSVLHTLLMRLAGSDCTHIMLSPRMGEDFKARFGSHRRYMILHNAIFIDRLLRAGFPERRLDPASRTVGFIGRLEASKGFDDFLALVQRTADDPRLRYVVAGDYVHSDYAAALYSLRARLGPRLDLRGFVSGPDKARFYRNIDVLVFPSKYPNEASPMVCYEALAMGIPVLVTRVGAVTDIVTPECGRVFERDSALVDEIAAQLRVYINEPARLAAQQKAATQRFRALAHRAESELVTLRAALEEAATLKGCQ